MKQVFLVSGPPGCGKTTWALKILQSHSGSRGYLRLSGDQLDGLEQGLDSGIDQAWLQDQVQDLELHTANKADQSESADNHLVLVELQQFRKPKTNDIEGYSDLVKQQLQTYQLSPTEFWHFGSHPDLPKEDTLEFSALEAWQLNLRGSIWDPSSLSSFWFELVNGAYGDVYRAKALMNLPDGRSFFCNWMVSREGSQFLPLEEISTPTGRPKRHSELVVQGKSLKPIAIQATINDCLISDEVLEMQQQQLRDSMTASQPA